MEPMAMPPGVPGGGLPQGMQAPPQGGMPPSLGAPPANVGPHTIPQHNPGNILQAMQKLAAANQMINDAIPQVPMGTPLHTKIMKISMELTKELGSATEQMKQQIPALLQQLQAAKAPGQMGMLQTAAPPAPNSPPAMPAPQQAA